MTIVVDGWTDMSGSMIEVMSATVSTPRMGRRSMALADIDPKYVSQSGIWEASEMETSRGGSIRIQHLTAISAAAGVRPLSGGTASSSGIGVANPRFPKLEECAHFHYDSVDLPVLKISIRDDPSKSMSFGGDEVADRCAFSIEVVSGGQSWAVRRTHANLCMLDEQLHRCVWDRSFSLLEKVEANVEDHDDCKTMGERYFVRLTELPTNKITCGTVLSWFELDNRGRHIVSSDDSAINTPAVAAACAVRKYTSQAADEISFEVGDMISVIDMPPPEESIWWRGKRGFHVGFFPREHVQVIGDKVPVGLPIVSSTRRLQRLSVSSNSSTSAAPAKPVLRKHGKLIAFFRSFILSRPSRRRLKQSGILRERVFSCDLAEHLLNSENEIPAVLKCCSDFIEKHGIVDGIYRLSGITSNIQKLRNAFDEDKVPNLAEDEAIKQDIHAVSSLLKMYFRELPNPLCTYQLYEKFVGAAQASDEQRLFRMREVVHELPPPHYRTLEYLMKHLARVAKKSNDTGMTPKNMAIVWAPNLIRCKELEAGGVAALKGIGVQAVVTEYLIRHADLIFNEKLPANFPSTTTLLTHKASGRPKSLAISSPIRLMSLEEAQDKAKDDRKYIEVGGGPSSLPPKYHTVIDLPSRRSALKNKRSPTGWRHFFSRNRSFSKPMRKTPTPSEITVVTKNTIGGMQSGSQSTWAGRLRPVKSVESLVSTPLFQGSGPSASSSIASNPKESDNQSLAEQLEASMSKSSPATPVADVHVVFHPPPPECMDSRGLLNPKTHNRSISHDSYFEFGEFRNSNNVYIDETLEEETMSHSSKLSLDASSGIESNTTSPKKENVSEGFDENRERRYGNSPRNCFRSPITPPPSAASLQPPIMSESITSVTSVSSDDYIINDLDDRALSRSPLLRQRPRPSKWLDTELLTSPVKLLEVESSIIPNSSKNDLRVSTPAITNDVNINSAYRRSQQSICSSENKYEMDRNSSIDESSADSTPGETFATTNIVYSPLVNEIPSPSSIEKLKKATNTAMQNSSLFICPLYEAGIISEDIPADPQPQVEILEGQVIPFNQNEPNAKINIPRYENFTPLCADINECSSDTGGLANNKKENHVYENNRVYENEAFASRDVSPEKTPENTFDHSVNTNSHEYNLDSSTQEELYGEHYEHINEEEDSDKSEMNDYEGNIYEDIDDDNISVQHDKNNYETVQVCDQQQQQSNTKLTSTPSPPLLPSSNSGNKLNASEVSDTETEAAYESVQFTENRNPNIIHHYAEIHDPFSPDVATNNKAKEEQTSKVENFNDKMATTVSTTKKTESLAATPNSEEEEESSPSYSRTEDVVTYLDAKAPSLKLREDSLESEKSTESKLETPVENSPPTNITNSNSNIHGVSRSNSTQTTSEEEEEEIRHIDSPLLIDNPLYGIQLEEEEQEEQKPEEVNGNNLEEQDDENTQSDNENDISMNESISIELDTSVSMSEARIVGCENKNLNGEQQQKGRREKLLGRCNSAPLTDTMSEFAIASSSSVGKGNLVTMNGDDGAVSHCGVVSAGEAGNNTHHSQPLMENGVTKKDVDKLILCKRLSEPSLLFSNNKSKSESDKSAATAAWKIADAKRLANRKQSVKELLSRFETKDEQGKSTSPVMATAASPIPGHGLPRPDSRQSSNVSRPLGGSGRFQHHRFSMGDILMSQSVSAADDLRAIKTSTLLIRSDTFPELRTEASKENQVSSDSDCVSQALSESGPTLVAEKVQQALRVAMSSVDMNDPNTRERIEKYKEERRTFLRQKISSELTTTTPKSPSDGSNKGSLSSLKSPELSISSSESVFGSSCKLLTPDTSIRSSESPRKRAFSEDIPPFYSNQTKAIKTETLTSTMTVSQPNVEGSAETLSGSESMDEVNVREKVALWSINKTGILQSSTSFVECIQKSKEDHLVRNSKSTLKEASSLPVDGFTTRPILRREVTTSSIEISKTKLKTTRTESGKKIKDMAAFFERKQF